MIWCFGTILSKVRPNTLLVFVFVILLSELKHFGTVYLGWEVRHIKKELKEDSHPRKGDISGREVISEA